MFKLTTTSQVTEEFTAKYQAVVDAHKAVSEKAVQKAENLRDKADKAAKAALEKEQAQDAIIAVADAEVALATKAIDALKGLLAG